MLLGNVGHPPAPALQGREWGACLLSLVNGVLLDPVCFPVRSAVQLSGVADQQSEVCCSWPRTGTNHPPHMAGLGFGRLPETIEKHMTSIPHHTTSISVKWNLIRCPSRHPNLQKRMPDPFQKQIPKQTLHRKGLNHENAYSCTLQYDFPRVQGSQCLPNTHTQKTFQTAPHAIKNTQNTHTHTHTSKKSLTNDASSFKSNQNSSPKEAPNPAKIIIKQEMSSNSSPWGCSDRPGLQK